MIKPTPMNGMAIYLILSVFAVIAPIILAILIDIRLIALLPACSLPICYMIYRIAYLDKCSIIINHTDKSVTSACLYKRKRSLGIRGHTADEMRGKSILYDVRL